MFYNDIHGRFMAHYTEMFATVDFIVVNCGLLAEEHTQKPCSSGR
jgi:lactate dehydrogenase-like 2-hydroxyacid dehydrogenase